jgi:hypothetical protein
MMTLTNRFKADDVITQTASGLAGEHIAAASVLGRGWRVSMSQQDAVDLIAWHPDTGQMLRIQVKSCQASRQGPGHRDRRVHFQTGLGGRKRLPSIKDYDILACVSADQRAVWYIPVVSINTKKYTRPCSFFEDPHLESDSWANCLKVLADVRR